MTTIGPVGGRPGVERPTVARGGAAGGFHVPADIPASGPDQAAPMGGVATVSLDAMLAAEALDLRARRDSAARRHGHAVLGSLAALQRALLGGGDPAATLAQLAALLADPPPVDDSTLASLLDTIVLRARVELARHGA